MDKVTALSQYQLTALAREICEIIDSVKQATRIKNLLLEVSLDDNRRFKFSLHHIWTAQRHWSLTNLVSSGYDANIFLMPGIWTSVRNTLVKKLIAAVPCYDRVLFCDVKTVD